MANYLSEDNIEQADIQFFELQLGYEHINCYNDDRLLGRNSKKDVVSQKRLLKALKKLNPDIADEKLNFAIESLTTVPLSGNPLKANKDFYYLIRNGTKVKQENEDGKEETKTIKIIDFKQAENNEFLLVSQLWIEYQKYENRFRRPDLLIYVNGLPLVFIELKNAKENVKKGYDKNLTDYKRDIPQLFWYNLMCAISNGSETRVGSFSAGWEHFFSWIKIESEKEKNTLEGIRRKSLNQDKKISLQLFSEGLCKKDRLLDYFENFVLYSHINETPKHKIIAKNHQYHGVNNALEAFKNRDNNKGKLGVFWHTQGSGKSYSMIFFARKIRHKIIGNFSFLIITDRNDLNKQIWRNFHETETISEKDDYVPGTRKKLKTFLASNRAYVFSLIQGFGTKKGIQYKTISERKDWIVIIDEAHRTQYKALAENMHIALPNAQYIAFTGTPLLQNELTKTWFGEYISQYNFQQSIEDGATVPLYYNKRVPEVILENEDLDEEISEIFAEAEFDEEQAEKLEREYASMLEVVKREERLKEIAADIVKHFPHRLNALDEERNKVPHKAMVISVDKYTALKMHDLTKDEIKKRLRELNKLIAHEKVLQKKIRLQQEKEFLKETEMAVVVSEEAGEKEKFAKLNLDIEKHRNLFISDPETGKNVEDYFKDPTHKLRIVFVCSMWLTGFDAPAVSTLYLDKPMQNHTLMQTIARANRVFPGKQNGLVIDYFGVFRKLKKAFAAYAHATDEAGNPKEELPPPVKIFDELLKLLKEALSKTDQWCKKIEIDIQQILNKGEQPFKQIALFDDFADIILQNDDRKRNFKLHINTITSLYDSAKPEIYSFPEMKLKKEVFEFLHSIVSRTNTPATTNDVRKKIDEVLDTSIMSTDSLAKESIPEYKIKNYSEIDLSKLDIEKLKNDFKKKKHKNIEFADLREFMDIKLKQMLARNKTRTNFLERFKELIEEYNSGSKTIEETYEAAAELVKELSEEENRAAREGMSEEELELFDLLKKDTLTKKQKVKVKNAAKELIQFMEKGKKEVLKKDWYKYRQTKLQAKQAIENILDANLPKEPVYDNKLFADKANIIFNHILTKSSEIESVA
jgi:type I restriction enzyme R subunit